MKKMKKSTIIGIILSLTFCSLMIYIFRFQISVFLGDIFYKNYELDQLTVEEKLEDFEEFYEVIVTSVPYLDDIKELYGLDFVARKEYYRNEIMETKNNIEFYYVMKAISKDLASFHTDVCFPNYGNLSGLSCHHSKETLSRMGMEYKINAWYEEIGDYVLAHEDVGFIDAIYMDGKYIIQEYDLSENAKEMAFGELISIDGVSIDEYVVNNIMMYELHYDSLLDKPYRECYTLNDSVGEKVHVVWKDSDGNKRECDLFWDMGIEISRGYGYHFYNDVVENEGTVYSSYYTYTDDTNQLEYIKIDNMQNVQGNEIKNYLQNTKYDKVVIDLRNNYGGLSGYAQSYIYPVLYAEDYVDNYQFYMRDSRSNRAMIGKWMLKLMFGEEKREDNYYYSTKRTYQGEQTKDKEVWYLVGPGTGSAADDYIDFIKKNKLGTIVGKNTGGEGKGAGFICNSLPNSSLIYIYYPSEPVRENDQNVCLGTTPDIYVNQTVEEYKIYEKLCKEGEWSEYTSKLQYDTILKYVVNQ